MNALSKWIAAIALLSGAAYGQIPSTNDTSDGFENTGMGTNALIHVAPNANFGYGNTASGYNALYTNTTGFYNTAFGFNALMSDTSGCCNDAFGVSALESNTTGRNNSAFGSGALYLNATGNGNTAIGQEALEANATGSFNTATGIAALYQNATTNWNTADGWGALKNNKGSNNTATGGEALYSNTSGSWNTSTGYEALYWNHTGSNNTAMGTLALQDNRTGSNNIALGYHAGETLTGSNNIEIGNIGAASDNNMIKIGTESTQAKTFIAGIYNTSVTGSAVMVSSSGQLGVVVSSERFKTAIEPIGSDTAKLQELRPVKFRLKSEPHGLVQYGLIAEEVAKAYPELVIRDEKGRIDGVRYDELAPMLLNEVQKQEQRAAAQDAKISALEAQLGEMRTALLAIETRGQSVAQR